VSRYDIKKAKILAAAASSPKHGTPLLGHEEELLAALRQAEQAFEVAWATAPEERKQTDELTKLMRKPDGAGRKSYIALAKQLGNAIATIEDMDPTARRFLTWAAYTQGLVRPEPKSTVRDGRPVVARPLSLMQCPGEPSEGKLPLDEMSGQLLDYLERMRELVATTESDKPFVHYAGGGLFKSPGPPEGKTQSGGKASNVERDPLDAFIAVLWEFWTDKTGAAPTINIKDTTDEKGRAMKVPGSAAILLMFGAAQFLKNDNLAPLYDLAAVNTAMKQRQADLREGRSNPATE
jgi:hypothetical protein